MPTKIAQIARLSCVVALSSTFPSGCGDDSTQTGTESGSTAGTSPTGNATQSTESTNGTQSTTATSGPTGGNSETGMSSGMTETTEGPTTDPTTDGPTSDSSDTVLPDMGPPCEDTCMDGVCVGGVCCAPELACADSCCGEGEVCSFQECVVPGIECIDGSECNADEYCEYTLGEPIEPPECMGGEPLPTGKCLPKPPECPPGEEPEDGEDITCLAKCEYVPFASDFDVELKYYWGQQVTPPYASDIMMTPIVIQLDDDNCDGKVNERDIPEIVFSTFFGGGYFKQGTLHAISIVEGELVEKWEVANVTQPGAGLAGGDLNGDGIPEVVGCMNPGPGGNSCCDAVAQNTGVIAFDAEGNTLWTQPDTTKVHCGYEKPAIGDVDQDGNPEILVGWTLLDGATGAIKQELDPESTWGAKLTSLVDLDNDGFLDVTDGQRAYRADGTLLWDLRSGPDQIVGGYHGIGDFDLDGNPEIVVISSGGPHTMTLLRYDPDSPTGVEILRRDVDINDGISTAAFCNANSEYGGGAPTVADFDGDGVPDVGAAGAVGYIVFSGARMVDQGFSDTDLSLWFKTTRDCSSAVTGSSVFDFNGDGKAEVIYSDEWHLWMYDGETGENLIPSTCATNGTLWEYPLVADVDNDGQADIIVGSNAYSQACPDNNSRQSGIQVYGSASGSWVRTRRVWNQHTYHITNVEEDGSIPLVEPNNWEIPGLNNFRQNVQPEGEFAAPDLVVTILPNCSNPYALVARVRNVGQAAAPPGIPVNLYDGDPDDVNNPGMLLGPTMLTTQTLYPADAEDLILLLPDVPEGIKDGSIPVYGVVDDQDPDNHIWQECRTENNKTAGSGKCFIPG